MKLLPLYTLLAVAASASAASSAPCVGDSFDLPLPGADGVVIKYADVPSAQFPGIWQEGIILGYSYRLFANGEGELKLPGEFSNWSISFNCNGADGQCSFTGDLQAPERAKEISAVLGRCLLGQKISAGDFEPVPDLLSNKVTETARPADMAPVAAGPSKTDVEAQELTPSDKSAPAKAPAPPAKAATPEVAKTPAPVADVPAPPAKVAPPSAAKVAPPSAAKVAPSQATESPTPAAKTPAPAATPAPATAPAPPAKAATPEVAKTPAPVADVPAPQAKEVPSQAAESPAPAAKTPAPAPTNAPAPEPIQDKSEFASIVAEKDKPLSDFCGVAAVPLGPAPETLQRLLIQSGERIGSVDGILGSRTNRALISVLGKASSKMTIEEAIERLDIYLCR